MPLLRVYTLEKIGALSFISTFMEIHFDKLLNFSIIIERVLHIV